MSSRKLSDLTIATREKAETVIQKCSDIGVDILIYCTLRSVEEQSKLYRQSRSWSEIKDKILALNNRGFVTLANILDNVGPCNGPAVTNAGPGESFHAYGLAFDGVPLISGKAAWSYSSAKEHWDAFAEAGRLAGLEVGADWTTFRDRPHMQLGRGSNPLKMYSPDQINKMLNLSTTPA